MSGTAAGSAVAVGVFDGLHLGHCELLERALARARARGGEAVVVTFDPHPEVVLKPAFHAPAPLTPIPEKRERLRAMGIDVVRVLPFTRELAALEPEAFVDEHLVAPFRPFAMVVGADFALGRGRSGNVARLAAIGAARGFEVDPVPLRVLDGAPVTSTRIRELLERGATAEAARLLGRRYDLTGVVVTGNGLGRTLDCPTANLRLHDEKLLPGDGIYAAWARIDAGSGLLPAAVSLGMRPTFGGQERAIEAHLIDWSGELVGRELAIEFVEWLRPGVRFANVEALKEAMREDVARCRRLLHGGPAATSTHARESSASTDVKPL